MKLTGRVAIVTGGGRGIGKGIALALAKEGASIAAVYRREEAAARETVAEIEALGSKAIAIQADVSDYEKVKAAVAQTLQTFGKIDILINNAGIASRGNFVADTDAAEMQRVVGVHFFGAFYFTKEVLPHMRKNPRGDIHFISSRSPAMCPPGHGPYACGKAAMEALAKVVAKEELKNNIRVNIIACGVVETEMGKRLVKATRGVDNIKDIYPDMPFGRVCQPEDVGNLSAFLCSADGGYVSGYVITLDGGGSSAEIAKG